MTIRINFLCQKLREIFLPELRKFFGIAGVKQGKISGKTLSYLKIFLAMKDDGFGFDLSVLDVDFVSTEDNGDVFADPG